MFTVQHWQRGRDELQKQYNLLTEEIAPLIEVVVIATDPEEKFRLKGRLKAREAERNEVAKQIQELEDQIEALDITSRLHKALLKLDYHQQEMLFRQLIGRSQVGAFLIHGEPDYGQSWLLNRLVSQVPHVGVGKVIPINLQFRGRRWDFDAMQREMRRCVGLANARSLQDVVEQIHSWWQTQTVVLIFHNVDTIDAQYMREFIQGFWLPLVERAMNVPCRSPYYRLLMFLIDNNGCVDTWNFDCVEQLDASWKPHVPIKPPRLNRMHRDDLMSWVRYECATLPASILNTQIEDILEKSEKGIPQFVLEHICELCNCDWYEKEPLWIRY